VRQIGFNCTQYLHWVTRPTLHDEKAQPLSEPERYQYLKHIILL
jgi:hypothetical protein